MVKVKRKKSYGFEHTKNPATITWIANFFNYSSRSYVSKIINSLVKKRVIFKEFDEEDSNNNTEIKHKTSKLYLNPELFYRGNKNKIPSNLCEKLNNYRSDDLDEKEIALPWKLMKREKGSSGKLYDRRTYLKEQDKNIDITGLKYINQLINSNISRESFKRISILSQDFTEKFQSKLEKLIIPPKVYKDGNEGKLFAIINNFNNTIPLKKEFEKFINLIYKSYKYSEDENFDQNNLLLIFANFFETTYCCTHIPDNDKYQDSNYENWEKDHTKLLIHELFLYLINFFLEKSEYQLVYQFLNIDFDFIENEYYNADYKGFPVFSFNLSKESCPLFTVNKHHRKKYKIRELLNTFRKRISLDRNIRNQGLLKTDLLLYYLSLLYDKKFDRKWFPRIYLTGCEKPVNKFHFENRTYCHSSCFTDISFSKF